MKTHPKIMFYHDGRHPHMYRYEPPMSKDEMNAMIDELVSTSVDAFFEGADPAAVYKGADVNFSNKQLVLREIGTSNKP